MPRLKAKSDSGLNLRIALAALAARPTCSICGQKIDPALRHPDPLSYSEDHVLPKSLFGEGVKRPAHLVCNQRKGTKLVRPVTPRGRVIARVVDQSSQRKRVS
jgi:hypothetical protein